MAIIEYFGFGQYFGLLAEANIYLHY